MSHPIQLFFVKLLFCAVCIVAAASPVSGAGWSALGTGLDNTVHALAWDGSGNLYAGGEFTTAGGVPANYIAKWGGSNWIALGTGLNNTVYALAWDGSSVLYAGGVFNTAGGVPADGIAKWDGSNWIALGLGVNSSVHALACDGGGNLYAGGEFTTAGGVSANYIAKWDGSNWSSLGTGMNDFVLSLACDGSGNLYAGGFFTTAGGNSANYIAKWDGSNWSVMGTGVNDTVHALVYDGSGNLYAGGFFNTAGSVAKWDGSNWSALGTGINNVVYALSWDWSVTLYAGGLFSAAGLTSANNVAKWSPTYTVTYNSNGCTSGWRPDDQTKFHGVDLILATNTGSLAKTGYTFTGWNTAADGSGAHYDEGATYSIDVAMVLYAEWRPDIYTVTYNSNGSTSGTVPDDQAKSHGVVLTLATNTGNLARTGYTFIGWNTAADGSGAHYDEGATYTTDAAMVLYAEWTSYTPQTVPAMSSWGMIIFALLMGGMAILLMKKRCHPYKG